MPTLAWSTVAILVLLLPGFFFFIGLYLPERFSRDVTPKNPIGILATTVLVAFATHTILSSIFAGIAQVPWARWLFRPVDWTAVIEVVQLAPVSPGRAGLEAPVVRADSFSIQPALTGAAQAAKRFEHDAWRILAYLVTSSASGAVLGYSTGLIILRRFTGMLQHDWVYDFQAKGEEPISYVHVLADVAHDGQQLLFRGRLRHFGLTAEGTFSYLVLLATEQRFLRLTGTEPATGPRRAIGAGSIAPESEESGARLLSLADGPASSEKPEQVEGDGALLVISSPNMKEVVLQGYRVIEPPEEEAIEAAESTIDSLADHPGSRELIEVLERMEERLAEESLTLHSPLARLWVAHRRWYSESDPDLLPPEREVS